MALKRKNGSEFWGMVSGSAVDPAWPQDGSIWIYSDVSERRAAEQELLRHRAHLEELVAQRTRELAAALKQATSASSVKNAFLANLQPGLRTAPEPPRPARRASDKARAAPLSQQAAS